jgi:hypothetical protein
MVRKLVELPKFLVSTLEQIPLGTVAFLVFTYCCLLYTNYVFAFRSFDYGWG